MTSTNKQSKNEVMEGYNPRIYRRLSMLFGILTILNLVVIIYAFAFTGYGLWHAEDALSYIAKVNSSFENINENVLNIMINADDRQFVTSKIKVIDYYHKEITKNADNFRKIDLKRIDSTVPADFDDAMTKIELYYETVLPKLEAVKNNTGRAESLRSPELESLREDASSSISTLFEKQDESTYGFFCRVGQSFLLVPAFLILTMSAGLFAISKSRKRDFEFALNLKSSKQKTDHMREKAKAIAYTNVLTGMRNRYVFSDRLKDCMSSGDVNIALYSFNSFRKINAKYGRETADEFIIAASKKLIEEFGLKAEIFSTETDELCVMFNQDISQKQAFEYSKRILELLSQPFKLNNITIQMDVAGCFKNIPEDPYSSASSVVELFVAVDQCMNQVISACTAQSNSLLMQA